MVIFLVGLVSMILMRTLRKDYARYSRDEEMDDMERDLGDEYGWKQVHGDVFRPASHAMLFSALIGAGYQVYRGHIYTLISRSKRTKIVSSFIFVYKGHSGSVECNYLRYPGRTLYGTRFNVVNGDICICCHIAHQWLRRWRTVRADGWTRVDQTDDPQRFYAAGHGLRHCFLHQFYRHVLPR